MSEALARSALFGGGGVSPRVAFILTTLRDNPELIAAHAEELASLALPVPAFDRLRHVLLGLADGEDSLLASAEAAIEAAGCQEAADRLAVLAGSARLRRTGDPLETLDADAALRQALTLQRRFAALHTDLPAAQTEYAADLSDRNLHRLSDLRAQLSSKEGLDAAADDSTAPR